MRLIKLQNEWYSLKELKTFIELLEKQETTDKDEPGEYVLNGFYKYTIDDQHDIKMGVLR